MLFSLFSSSVYVQIQDWKDVNEGGCMVDGVPTLKCLEVVFGNLLYIASAFFILVLFIMLVIGAFNFLTSFGNAEKVKKAQGIIKFAVIGLVLFMMSYLILFIIGLLFLGDGKALFKFEISQ